MGRWGVRPPIQGNSGVATTAPVLVCAVGLLFHDGAGRGSVPPAARAFSAGSAQCSGPGGPVTWRGLNLFVGAVCVFAIAYCVSGAETSPLAVALFRLAPPLGVALWVEADARRLRQIPC